MFEEKERFFLRQLIVTLFSVGIVSCDTNNTTYMYQSPIAIDTNTCKPYSPIPTPLTFTNYWDYEQDLMVYNTGETVKVEFESDPVAPTVYGGPLNGTYELIQMHFHWGGNDDVGSEHTFNGNRFSMEAHFVHYKQDYGRDDKEVLKIRDGIAVFAFFIEEDENNDTQVIQPFIDVLKDIKDVFSIGQVNARNIMGYFNSTATAMNYFTYMGSLTSPPYSEVVTWIVYHKPISISANQSIHFRQLTNEHGEAIVNNYRETQPLHNRTVHFCATAKDQICGNSTEEMRRR